MRVSVCMIVRNEEYTLPIALGSVEGLADEVVILDTGSEDDTVEVARRLGAHVFEGGDRMHKGEARNQAMGAATGDWVVVLDADEQIIDPVGLRAFLETTDAQAVYVREKNVDRNENVTLIWSRMLCWRRGAYRYKYRCHEIPMPTDGWGKIVYTNFVWEHRPPPERAAWKSDYALARLELDVEENPGGGRPLYYIGRQYMYRGKWQKSVEMLRRYLETPATHDRADVYWCLSKCFAKLGQQAEQIQALYQACALQPGRREWWGNLATIYHDGGQDVIAVALLKAALELPPPPRGYAMQYWHGPAIHDLLARCLWKLERHEEGRIYAEKALELSPESSRLRENLRYFVESRYGQLQRVAPELYSRPGTLLYIGANPTREPQCVGSMHRAGHEITLLEIWPDNVAHFRADARFTHVVLGDVRKIRGLTLPHCRYDAILWWHGPEHIGVEDLPGTLAQLESLSDLIVLACPWGVMKQGPYYGNPHETHLAYLEPRHFPAGYDTDTVGAKDTRGGHLIAWKRSCDASL